MESDQQDSLAGVVGVHEMLDADMSRSYISLDNSTHLGYFMIFITIQFNTEITQ